MKPKTFLAFVGPSVAMMLIFIAVPLVLVLWQSFHVTSGRFEEQKVEVCTPGFPAQTCTDELRLVPVMQDGRPVSETRFAGFENYALVLQPDAVVRAFGPDGEGVSEVLGIDFYKALRFTLTFTLVTLPFVLAIGLGLALAVESLARAWRGPVIFVSLLPYVITPVIGALSIRWLFVGDGILTALLRAMTGTDITVFAHGWATEILMLFYRVWHVAPFAFVVFYAGLQTVNKDTLESAIIDGASRFERLRYVVLPHLMPLIVFVTLIHLMDAYRVFEEVVGFSSQAYRISLQWLTYSWLTPDNAGNRAIPRASATAMLTMVGIVLLLIPVLRRTWRDHKRARAR
ncbi:MAG: sugar ABC transporter permease [Acetobacteraceae bacterium]|nr:sugar ABC transporter permease [Acetobacteraceae bacterium]